MSRSLDLLGGLVLLACAAPGEAAVADPSFQFTIAAGKFDEHCVGLAAGDEVSYRFEAGAPLDFNIHHHRGKDVFYPVRREAVQRLADRFRAPSADDYCLMWENKGTQAVTVRGAVDR